LGVLCQRFVTLICKSINKLQRVIIHRRWSGIHLNVGEVGIDGIERVRKDVESGAKLMNSILIAVLGALLAFMLVGTILTAQGLSESLKKEVSLQKIK
jgi:hypothetical protein